MPPVIKHLTWSNMNYAILVIISFAIIASLGYKTWGKSFTGPVIDNDYFELNNLETNVSSSCQADAGAGTAGGASTASGDVNDDDFVIIAMMRKKKKKKMMMMMMNQILTVVRPKPKTGIKKKKKKI